MSAPLLGGRLGAEARRKGWWSPRPGVALSNVLMSGGRLYVPDHEYHDVFLPAYASDVAAGVAHYIIERATSLSRWYADVDFAGALSDAQWEAASVAVAAAVERLAGKSSLLLCMIARGESKTGIHFVASDLMVSPEQMAAWHPDIVAALSAALPEVEGAEWAEALDQAVYAGGGSLRMIMSRKMVACRREAHDAACCAGRGKVDGGRAYTLLFALRRGGARDPQLEAALRRNTDLLVRKASIRCLGFGVPDARPAKRARGGGGGPRGSKGASDALCDVVAGLPREHAELRILDRTPVAQGIERLRVCGPGARFCANVGREHASSTVYYSIQHGVAWQKCFCRKGTCRGFARGPFETVRDCKTVRDSDATGTRAAADAPSPPSKRASTTLPSGFTWHK